MTLPDGCRLTLEAADQLACSEALFNPRAHGFEKQGLHELVLQTVGKIEAEHKKELLGNMVLSGGSSAIPRLGARLESEIESISQSLSNVKKVVFEHSQRQYLSWVGGSLLCSLQSFQTMWITRPEFEEHGPSIVLKKCY
ncbi:uncharacterized protein LOC127594808 [Hippocampus zosterae]|uniref:uncharacterized protein LOC127594808 n=1 Tax=Hippocampus zosterae TaxID=109293 RepID=UPI00223DEE05|nr:uncharacterized protein LOC127594808 [Hippocampus zosterae]